MENEVASSSCESPYLAPPQRISRGEALERPSEDASLRRFRLERLMRGEILQRLSDLHPWPNAPTGLAAVAAPNTADIELFADLVIAPNERGAAEFLARMMARGYDFETIVERLAAPTARRLGQLWEEDRCDFLDVTFGVGRLQEILALLSGAPAPMLRDHPRRALLISLPGDMHWFGLDVYGALLVSAGWSVTLRRRLSVEENERAVAEEWTHVAGFTLGNVSLLDELAHVIHAMRRASVNPGLAVIVGGAPFNREPDLAARVGADATAPDGPTGVVLAKRLLLRQIEGGVAAKL